MTSSSFLKVNVPKQALRISVLFLVLDLLCASCATAKTAPMKHGATNAKPPGQPASGPGSSATPHAGISKNQYGDGALAYWIYTPSNPVPASAPVILFLHGWNGMNPYYWGGWIDHLVKRGNIVIFPVFQTSSKDKPDEMIQNAIQGTKDALERLKRSDSVRPDLDKFAIVGHSFGGGLTAQIAARVVKAELPIPKAIMPVEPGWRGSSDYPTDPLSMIPSSVLMLVVVGDQDQFAKSRQGKTIFDMTKQIPNDHKRYIILQSDDHGNPPLLADHSSPFSPREDYSLKVSEEKKKRGAFFMRQFGMRDGEEDTLD